MPLHARKKVDGVAPIEFSITGFAEVLAPYGPACVHQWSCGSATEVRQCSYSSPVGKWNLLVSGICMIHDSDMKSSE